MVMLSYGAVIEFTHTAGAPQFPVDIYWSGYWHLVGTPAGQQWKFILHGFEPDDVNWAERSHDKTWSEPLTDAENEHLLHLLEQMKPDPPANMLEGCDGVWFTLEVREDGQQKQHYAWWLHPPAEWKSVAAVYTYVTALAKNSYARYRETSKQ